MTAVMIEAMKLKRCRGIKGLALAFTTLAVISIAPQVFAQSDSLPGPVSSPPLHGDVLTPEHRVKLNVPNSLIGDQSAQAPKFSIELGYGGETPSSSAPMARLPDGFGGRTDLRAVKAGISLGF